MSRSTTEPRRRASSAGRGRTIRQNTRKKKVVAARPAVSRGRVFALLVVLALLAMGFGWRLVDLQLTPDQALASEVGSRVIEVKVAAPRGEILDRHGERIAYSLPRPTIVANPRLLHSADLTIPDRDLITEAVGALSEVLSTDPATLRQRLTEDRAFAYLERQVDPEVGQAVLDLGLAGIYVVDEQRREHPHGDCSGIGVAGRVDLDQIGISGLELDYNDVLTGEDGLELRQSQAGGDVLIPGGSHVVDPMVPGEDLTLTMERLIQLKAETLITEKLEEVQGDWASVVVTMPGTGEVLAMANAVRDEETGQARCTTNNLAATFSYEPGSIMKSLTFASVFENDAWPEAQAIEIPHGLTYNLGAGVAPHTYRDAAVPVGPEWHTPAWILRKSSNNGTILMATEVGATNLYNTFVDFGLGKATALGLNGEASGILDPLDSHVLKLSNAAIGQSVAVTPLQMVLAYNTIANGGMHVDPVLVRDEIGSTAPHRVISEETADSVMNMMGGVISPDGTGRRAAIEGYTVSGKTGTAWQPCGNGYLCEDGSRHYTASFVGIISNDLGPALSVIVVIDNPQGAHYGGGDIAAPVFADVARFALHQLRIPPLTDAVLPDGRLQAQPALAISNPNAASGGPEES